jgi:DMSO/TMAO reductase YedYZ molybdopterin-dependent catalytic subunit
MERRIFIIAAVAGGIGLAEYGYISRWMNSLHRSSAPDVRGYEQYGERAALLAITANPDFYITSKGTTPRIEPASWQLRFDGLVERPFALSYAELLALPAIERELTLECIDNGIGGNTLGNASWTGTALKALIKRAQPKPGAAHVAIHAADGLSSGHPLDRFWREENFLAYRMNGEALPPNHGYPARIFIPGKWGMKQPKWVTRIEFLDRPYTGYWEKAGWSDSGERWAHARFSGLKEGATVSAQGRPIELTGYAIGNLDGIRTIEVSFDDSASWQQAEIFSNPSPMVWAFWRYNWIDPKSGTYRVRVRATDGQGRVEGYGPRGSYPEGATGQQVLKIRIA